MQFSYLTALFSAGAFLAAASPLVTPANQLMSLEPRSALEPRSNHLSSHCEERLQKLGLNGMGQNAADSSSGGVWIGSDGPYTNTFSNTSPHEVCLVVWGAEPLYQASFVGTIQPMVTVSLPPRSKKSVTLSFSSGQSGAWAGVYRHTHLSENGQIYNTWGEYTFEPTGAVDVSREVHTQGRHMKIETPNCETNMHRCVFKCSDPAAETCGTAGSYQLENCDQPGAQASPDGTSGGCGWDGASTVHLTTTLS